MNLEHETVYFEALDPRADEVLAFFEIAAMKPSICAKIRLVTDTGTVSFHQAACAKGRFEGTFGILIQ